MKIVNKLKENKIYRIMLASLFSFGGICALPFMMHMDENKLGYSNSIFSFFLWVIVAALFYKVLRHPFVPGKKRWTVPALFSALFVICMVFGSACDSKGNVPFTSIKMWISIFVLILLFTVSVRFAFDKILIALSRNKMNITKSNEKTQVTFFVTMGIILVCYIPVFMAAYPGFFVYDAQDELMQVVTRTFSTHHPLLHVMMLGGIVQLVYKISGSYNLGIACYIIFQMILLSGIFSYCICLLKKRGISLAARAAAALYFGLFPVIVMFSLCSTKDGLFTGYLLITFVLLQELFKAPKIFFKSKLKVILLIVSAAAMMLFRHNGYYAFLVFIPCFIWFVRKNRRVLAKTLALFAVTVVLYAVVNQSLILLLHANNLESQEMLTVPIQQMARVYNDEKDSLSAEEKNIIHEILPEEALVSYRPKLADPVKMHFNNSAYRLNPGKYRRLWVKWGIEHPFSYVNAWLMTSYGFWYPDTVIDVYRGNSMFTFTYEDSSYFGYEVEDPGVRDSKFPWLLERYRKMSLEVAQQKIPVISMLFSPGFLFLMSAFGLSFLLYTGQKGKAVPYMLPVLIWLTVILGPTYLVRYVVFLWVILPFLIADIWETAN